MKQQRLMILGLILVIAASVGIRHARKIRDVRASIAQLTEQCLETQKQTEDARSGLRTMQEELRDKQNERDHIIRVGTELAEEIISIESAQRWASPPETLPMWDPDSPYVWIAKDLLPTYSTKPFAPNGVLNPGIAEVLAATSSQVAALNQTSRQIVQEFRNEEAAHTIRTEDHIVGIQNIDGEKMSVVVEPMPEVSERLRTNFEETVVQQLGEQRANLLLTSAHAWMEEQFGWVGNDVEMPTPEPRTFSVGRHSDGTFSISVRSGHSWSSYGGVPRLDPYIPPHLQHFFAELHEP
jgi:hypothetical protein